MESKNIRHLLKTLFVLGSTLLLFACNLEPRELLTYKNQYKGAKLGESTYSDLVLLFGKELRKSKNTNNVLYIYPEFFATIQNETGKLNTVIVLTPAYTDENGVSVGDSIDEVLAKNPKFSGSGENYVDYQTGLGYWVQNKRISKIVLGAYLMVPIDR